MDLAKNNESFNLIPGQCLRRCIFGPVCMYCRIRESNQIIQRLPSAVLEKPYGCRFPQHCVNLKRSYVSCSQCHTTGFKQPIPVRPCLQSRPQRTSSIHSPQQTDRHAICIWHCSFHLLSHLACRYCFVPRSDKPQAGP